MLSVDISRQEAGMEENSLTVCWEPKSDAESALSEPIVLHANA
jgi:hypothetical protein